MRKGFTLVELLIVVVIIAILAALIIPRMVAQIERVKVAEALQTMGFIQRAVQANYDLKGTYILPSGTLHWDPFGGIDQGNWDQLGIKKSSLSNKLRYYYAGNATGYELWASNFWDSPLPPNYFYAQNTVTNSIDSWFCFGLLTNDSDATKACRLK